MNYEAFRVITIGIIIICLLAIIFKRQIKQWFSAEGFAVDDSAGAATTSTAIGGAATATTSTAIGGAGAATTSTAIGGAATTSTAIGGAATTSTSSGDAGTTTTTSYDVTDDIPVPTIKPDVANITYEYHVAGYVPVLDLVVSRILLLRIWLADWAEMEKTKLPTEPAQTLGQQITTTTKYIEKFGEQSQLYTERYADFESFFTAEIRNIPRLNIFITKSKTSESVPNMDILFSNFKKPEWVTRMVEFYKDPAVDPQKVNEYVSVLKGDLPQEREDNTSNIFNAGEITSLTTLTMPIELRERVNRLGLTQLKINLDLESEPASGKAPAFNELTLGLLKFISSYYPTLSMLYINPDDDNTQVLLGLSKDDIFSVDDLVKPTLVQEVRRQDSWNLSTVLGYPDSRGITYNTSLLFNTPTRRLRPGIPPKQTHAMRLLSAHTKSILKLARRAILQNAAFGTDVPEDLIYEDGIESVTDNIYTYYFNILKAPIANAKRQPTIKDFDNMGRERIFAKLKPHMQPIYPDLVGFQELSIQQKITLDNAITTGVSDDERKRLDMEYKKTLSKIKYLENKVPYVIYLPIYDFQYIKIVPRRQAGGVFMPDISMNIR
jgi:hypothetical protein